MRSNLAACKCIMVNAVHDPHHSSVVACVFGRVWSCVCFRPLLIGLSQ